jgi:hypothetical protein
VGQLACDTGDIHTLQGMEADLPRLHWHRQPTIPVEEQGLSAHVLRMATATYEVDQGCQKAGKLGGSVGQATEDGSQRHRLCLPPAATFPPKPEALRLTQHLPCNWV